MNSLIVATTEIASEIATGVIAQTGTGIAETVAEESSDFGWTLANTRNLLHLIFVITWVGGQILMGALVPVIRKIGPEAQEKISKQFNNIAWPAFILAIITGLWNMGSNWSEASDSWKTVLFIKLLLVILSGLTAWLHQKVEKKSTKAFNAASTMVLSLVVVVLGIGLGN